ncbi:MAG: hypothetical protein IJW79_04305 [Clostridia bacterium]|nr:hypothetical protein [Clostridia bacterium]
MRYKASVIICGILVLILALSFFFTPEVTESQSEMRSMRTFGMIVKDIDTLDENGQPIFTYNVGVSYPDRLENALKDQIFLRDGVMGVYNGVNESFANLYYSVDEAINSLMGKKENVIVLDEGDETDVEPVLPPVDVNDEYYDLKEEAEEPPTATDYSKYPGYGYARLAGFPERSYTYRKIGSLVAYNGTDYVGASPSKGVVNPANVQKHVDQYEKLLDVYPNLKFYSYFVTQMQDTPWFYDTFGVYPDKHETIAQYLPEYMGVSRLIFSSFADYQDCYFKSDHHWAYKGSERAYRDVYAMMAEELELSPVKYPIETWNFSELFDVEYRGSRANNLRNNNYEAYDEFIAYEYDLGERETYVLRVNMGKDSSGKTIVGDYTKEIPVTMGLWERYKVGNIRKDKYFDHYINFYGRAYDASGKEYADSDNMFVIKNKDNGAKHNMLLVCDSSQRPYRDVLASHFGTLVTLDYRIIPYVPIDYIIDTYNIDVIFFGGQSFAWSGSNQYLFRFSENFGK